MVHRKSEYRLQFHILANDLRKQIWQDNLRFRESCRLTNQSHHYWSYQVTEDPCECDKPAIEEDEKDNAPLPPHRLKHKFLLSIYGSKTSPEKSASVVDDAVPTFQSTALDQQQTHVQSTAEIKNTTEDIVLDRSVPKPEVPEDICDEAVEIHTKSQPSAPPLPPPPAPPVPELPANLNNIPVHPQPSSTIPQFRPFQPISSHQPGPSGAQRMLPVCKSHQPSPRRPSTPQPVVRGAQRMSSDVTGRQPSPIRVSFPTPVVDYGAVHRIPPRPITPSRGSQVPSGMGDGTQSSPSCISHLSRTSKRMYSDERKKSPFAAFGWNDTNKDVGDKKTYNVSAPEAQVYDNALRALKKRREEIEKFLAKEAALRRHLSACDYGVNHSSIWMSEYREKFGGGANCSFAKPPLTAAPPKPLSSWRCYS